MKLFLVFELVRTREDVLEQAYRGIHSTWESANEHAVRLRKELDEEDTCDDSDIQIMETEL